MLVWARKSAGFHLEDAAHKAQVELEILRRWEQGEDRPTVAQLRKLGEVYKRPIAVFHLPEERLLERVSNCFAAAAREYQNRAIETAAVIQELIELAKEMREANNRGENLGLTEEELAFYDALETNDSAVRLLGEPTLKKIAQELVQTIRNNVTIDWTERESMRARLRVVVRCVLRKYGYPPDKQEKATKTVLEQAELLCHDWAVA